MSPPDLAARPFDPAEAALLIPWFPTEAALVQWGGRGLTWPLDAAQWDHMQSDPNRTFWTVTLASDLAGHFQIFTDRRSRSARLGRVAIAPWLRGQGLGTALARLAANTAFADPALHRFSLHVYDRNMAARAAYERAGFRLEGVMREDVPVTVDGVERFWSTGVMAMLRPEWEGGHVQRAIV